MPETLAQLDQEREKSYRCARVFVGFVWHGATLSGLHRTVLIVFVYACSCTCVRVPALRLRSGLALMNSRESRYAKQQRQIEDLEAEVSGGVSCQRGDDGGKVLTVIGVWQWVPALHPLLHHPPPHSHRIPRTAWTC